MTKKNAILNENEEYSEFSSDSFDFDDIEEKLQIQLEEEFADLEFLEDGKEKTENPDNLGAIIGNVVWEQVIKQIGEVAGEEFIKENSGLTLDLRDTAHIQTTENFKEGKIANHK